MPTSRSRILVPALALLLAAGAGVALVGHVRRASRRLDRGGRVTVSDPLHLPAEIQPIPGGASQREPGPDEPSIDASVHAALDRVRAQLLRDSGPRGYAVDLCELARALEARPREVAPILFAVLDGDPDNRMRVFAALVLGLQKTPEIEAALLAELDIQTDGGVLVGVLYGLLSMNPIRDPSHLTAYADEKIAEDGLEQLWFEILREFPEIYSLERLFQDLQDYLARNAAESRWEAGRSVASLPSGMINYYFWNNGLIKNRTDKYRDRRYQELLVDLARDQARPERLREVAIEQLPPSNEYTEGTVDGLIALSCEPQDSFRLQNLAIMALPLAPPNDEYAAKLIERAPAMLQLLGDSDVLGNYEMNVRSHLAENLARAFVQSSHFNRCLDTLPTLPGRSRELVEEEMVRGLTQHFVEMPRQYLDPPEAGENRRSVGGNVAVPGNPEEFAQAWAIVNLHTAPLERGLLLNQFRSDLDGTVRQAALNELIGAEHPYSRHYGVGVLKNHGTRADIVLLERMAQTEPEDWIRDEIPYAIRGIRARPRRAGP